MPLAFLAVALTFGTGAMDVASFTRLGGVFSSVMTGNLVLLGLAAARPSGELAAHTASAFAGYVTGAALGTWIAGSPRPREQTWPVAVTVTLVVELAVMGAFSAGWGLTHGQPTGGPQLVLIVVATLGMDSKAPRCAVLARRSPLPISPARSPGWSRLWLPSNDPAVSITVARRCSPP